MEKRIEIQKKRKPVFMVSVFMIVLCAFALWLLLQVVYPMLEGFFNLKLTAVVVIVSLTIWVIVITIKQSSRKHPGLIIDEKGVTDYSNMLGVGFIPWSDITAIKEATGDLNRKLIVILVKSPAVYVNKISRYRASLQYQYQHFGSPIVINSVNLDYDVQELSRKLKSHVETENLHERRIRKDTE